MENYVLYFLFSIKVNHSISKNGEFSFSLRHMSNLSHSFLDLNFSLYSFILLWLLLSITQILEKNL